MKLTLNYGVAQFECELPDEQIRWQQLGPAAVADLDAEIARQFAAPIDYPQLQQAVVPGDQIAIVVDCQTPHWPELVDAAAQQLISAGVEPKSIHVLLNGSISDEQFAQLTKTSPYSLVSFEHTQGQQSSYLATTADGVRIYLPETIAHADYVVTVGRIGFDDQWGYHGTHSAVYPAFATAEEQSRLRGKSHRELTPESSLGVRQLIDEVGWLLGVQYTIQVIPSGSAGVAQVLCGASDSVFRKAVDQLNGNWRSPVTQKAETVIVTIPGEQVGNPWDQLARATRAAAQLVQTDGRVVLLTDIGEVPDALADLLDGHYTEDELLRHLNRLKTSPANALHALIRLTTRAKLFLRSRLSSDTVENMFCIPLESEAEIQHAIDGGENFAILNGGQFAYIDAR